MTTALTNSATTSNATSSANPEEKRLLAGKYPTVEELERAYNSQMTETNKIIAQRDGMKRQLDVLVPLVESGTGMNARGDNSGAGSASNPLQAIADAAGITIDQLVGAMGEIADAKMTPLVSGLTARQVVASEHADFAKFEGEVHQFLEANPDVKARVRAAQDPVAAIEYAYLKWQNAAGKNTGEAERVDVTGTDVVTAKLDAQIVTGGGARTAPSRSGAVEAALARARESGNKADWTAYLGLALGDDNNR